ncbi:MAG: NADH-quinone oxidoreductase subunit N [Flavobacteriales bacterium]
MNILILVSVLGVISLFAGLSDSLRQHTRNIIIAGLVAITGLTLFTWNAKQYFQEMIDFDKYAAVFTSVILVISTLVFILSKDQFNHDENSKGDYYGIMLFTVAGAIMMVSFSNLTVLFIGIETLSVSLYTLAGSRRDSLKSSEASFKYFLLGAFATGFLLFGITFIYGATGTFSVQGIADYVHNTQQLPTIFYGGVILIMIGLLFKVSAAPFHFWAPDVYEGSPNIITSFMATAVKVTAFAAFYRLFSRAFADVNHSWDTTLIIAIALTLLIGNFSALAQSGLKRLLAYSGIANAGYMLLAVLALKNDAADALLYYSVSYAAASLGAFAVLIKLSEDGKTFSIDSLKGLSKSNPLLAVLFTIIMLSMAGIPPLSGFFAKYMVLSAAINQGYLGISLLAILTSLVGIYYYFKVIAAVYGAPTTEVQTENKAGIVVFVCAGISLVIGLMPDLILGLF